jgi:hypothetical protein
LGWSLLGAAVVLFSPVLIEQYSYAQSEPLYLLLTVFGFVLLSLHASNRVFPGRRLIFVASAIVSGGIWMTRYIGISAVFAGVLVLFVQTKRDGLRRFYPGLIYGLIASLPMVCFLLRNQLVAGNLTNRPMPYIHLPGAQTWIEARNAVENWFLPGSFESTYSSGLTWAGFGLILVLISAIMLIAWRRGRRLAKEMPGLSYFLLLNVAYLFSYSSLLILTVFVFDALTPVDARLLSPVYFCTFLVIVLLLGDAWIVGRQRNRIMIGVFMTFVFINLLIQSARLVPYLSQVPQGLASPIYQSSETIEYVRGRKERFIYTNDIEALYFWGSRKALPIPVLENPHSRQPADPVRYFESLNDMRERFKQDEALLVIVGSNPRGRLDPDQWDDLTQGLSEVVEFYDGIIFEHSQDENGFK